MHEMALAASVLKIVEDAARAHNAAKVLAVRVAIGRLAHVEPSALQFAFDAATFGTLAEDASLEIQAIDGIAWCANCCQTIRLTRYGDACPECGGYQLQVTAGEDMRVVDIQIA